MYHLKAKFFCVFLEPLLSRSWDKLYFPSNLWAEMFLLLYLLSLSCAKQYHCSIYSVNIKLRGILVRGNCRSPSLPGALNAAWATAGWVARGAWWEMEAVAPAAVLEHRSVVRFTRALIREPPLRKHTCRQPMRRCHATHTGPAYTRTDANTLANGAKTHIHTHLQSCSEFGLQVLIWFVSKVKNIKSNYYRQTWWTSSSLMEGSLPQCRSGNRHQT